MRLAAGLFVALTACGGSSEPSVYAKIQDAEDELRAAQKVDEPTPEELAEAKEIRAKLPAAAAPVPADDEGAPKPEPVPPEPPSPEPEAPAPAPEVPPPAPG